jgi:hypothetical protein
VVKPAPVRKAMAKAPAITKAKVRGSEVDSSNCWKDSSVRKG